MWERWLAPGRIHGEQCNLNLSRRHPRPAHRARQERRLHPPQVPEEETLRPEQAGQAEKVGNDRQVDLALLMEIPLQVTVELGRAKITVENLLRLTQGSVVELNRVTGEPLDIYVNNRLVARGEAVVVKEKFGVRIIDVISPEKRVESLH